MCKRLQTLLPFWMENESHAEKAKPFKNIEAPTRKALLQPEASYRQGNWKFLCVSMKMAVTGFSEPVLVIRVLLKFILMFIKQELCSYENKIY